MGRNGEEWCGEWRSGGRAVRRQNATGVDSRGRVIKILFLSSEITKQTSAINRKYKGTVDEDLLLIIHIPPDLVVERVRRSLKAS
jgi:hypothetical protein